MRLATLDRPYSLAIEFSTLAAYSSLGRALSTGPAYEDAALTENGQVERLTQQIGGELLGVAMEQRGGVLSSRFWSDRFIRWAMQDPGFKVQLFRFVDVLPMLPGSGLIHQHLLEYLNQPGVTISADAPRIPVYHWALDDIPATVTSLAAGAESEGLVAHGKPVGMTDHGRRGANVYTTFLAGNAAMAGTYGGYDGPCPPVNDERPHHYVVRVFALDVPSLGLSGPFDGAAVEQAMRGHILAEGQATATYALNPSLAR